MGGTTAELYGGITGGGAPALNIGVTVRNDYASADLGAHIGNITGSYISSVTLGIRFYSWNGSIVEVPKAHGITAPTASSNTAMGGGYVSFGEWANEAGHLLSSPFCVRY